MATQRLNEQAAGVFIISATPFADDGSLDLQSTDRLIEFYIEQGVSGITVLGMMGEAHKLSANESAAFLKRVLQRVADRVPVVVGVSNAGMDNLTSLAHTAMEAGAAGVMVAPTAGLGTEAKVMAYFRQVFAGLGESVPVCYQDYPFVTRSEISVATFNQLVADYPQLVMLKHEEWPGLGKLSAVRKAAADGLRRVAVLVGNGGLYLPQELARGADGAMTGFAYPEMLVEVVRLWRQGEQDRAEDLFDAYLPLVRHEQQPGFGLALRKEVLRRRGAIATAHVRAPGPQLSAIDFDELTRLITRVEKNLEEV
ncbi:MAG: dihydrodipicolinate synthase family protein [Woeseia sp.]